jgi:predicted dehydrogenase
MNHPSDDAGSRRRFLQTAAGTMAAGALAGCTFGRPSGRSTWDLRPDQPAPKARPRTPLKEGDTIQMAVIGTGGPDGCSMGQVHAETFAKMNAEGKETVRVAALCDLNQLHLDWGRERLQGVQKEPFDCYSDYRKVLARDDLHGVLLAVPEHWHAQLAIEAIAAGKDVYLEKPMTLNLPDALRLWEAAKANPDIIVQVGTQQVNDLKWHEARRLIRTGAIGTPTMSQTSYCRNSKSGEWHYTINEAWKPGVNLDWDMWCRPLGPMPWDPKVYYQWRRYRKTSTGIIGDLLVHVMTPMLMALEQGWPVKVAATGGHLVDKAMQNHDDINIVAQFETGHQMTVMGSTCNEAGLEPMIRGHKANLYLSQRNCVLRPERVFAEEIEQNTIECKDVGDDQDRHRLKWMHCIRTREQPDSTVELGVKVMVIVDFATRSMWEGGAFAFDPEALTATRL